MEKWNWMGSNILTKAVQNGVVTEMEAEAVMEQAVYERDFWFIARELAITPDQAYGLYQAAIPCVRCEDR